MNLTKLFEIQKQLDERIATEHNLQGQDLLPKKILALQVELGELANEWRGFKFWSKNQSPRNRNVKCHACHGLGGFVEEKRVEECLYCDGTGTQESNPLLEEYVDCLHFILSIGLEPELQELGFSTDYTFTYKKEGDILSQFEMIFSYVDSVRWDGESTIYFYQNLIRWFVGLADLFNITWTEVEQAYLEKNKINHQRQESGY